MASLSAICTPVLLDTNPSTPTQLLHQWARLYHYGHIYMPALAVATTGLYAYAALLLPRPRGKCNLAYAVAGAVTIAMVPFTWVVMAPTNNVLFGLLEEADGAAAVGLPELRPLLVKWAWLHVTRSLFPLSGALLGLLNVGKELGL